MEWTEVSAFKKNFVTAQVHIIEASTGRLLSRIGRKRIRLLERDRGVIVNDGREVFLRQDGSGKKIWIHEQR